MEQAEHIAYWLKSAEHDLEEQQDFLLEINQFNIKARYPDYKFEFYKKCTPEFTQNSFTKIKDLYQWLLQQM